MQGQKDLMGRKVREGKKIAVGKTGCAERKGCGSWGSADEIQAGEGERILQPGIGVEDLSALLGG